MPLLDIRAGKDSEAIETRTREAWRKHTRSLVKTHADLRARGLDVATIEENSALAFSLPLDDPSERVLDMGDCPDGASEFEVHLGHRVRELETGHRPAVERDRIGDQTSTRCESGPPPKAQPDTLEHRPRIPLVGPTRVTHRVLLDELTRQGSRLALSPSESHGTSRQGIGLRFFDMSHADESALIDYLTRTDDRVGG